MHKTPHFARIRGGQYLYTAFPLLFLFAKGLFLQDESKVTSKSGSNQGEMKGISQSYSMKVEKGKDQENFGGRLLGMI